MENESPQQLYNISEMYQLCKHQKKCYEGEPDKKVCSFMGIIIDCSNYVAGYQKIFIIDDSIQKNPLIIFLRGESNESFITNAKIGDVVFFKYFQVGFYEEQLMAVKSEDLEQSKFELYRIKKDENSENKQNQAMNNLMQEGLEERIQVLFKFSFNYFKTQVVNQKQTFMIQENPENEEKKSLKVTNKNMIVRVVDSQIHKNSYYLKITDQNQMYIMKFNKQIEPGVYLLRAYATMKKEHPYMQIQGNPYTNLLQISPWMLSFDINQRISFSNESSINQFTISTKILRQNVPRISLQQLRQSDEHFNDIRVRCEIMEVTTTFEKMFRKLVIKKKGKRVEYEEFNWEHPEGELILNLHMYISDPTIKGQIFSVYLYSFDRKGNDFIPGLNIQMVQEMILKNKAFVKRQYQAFINAVLQNTSYDKKPLELLLSPMSNPKLGTVYRIIDTVLNFQ